MVIAQVTPVFPPYRGGIGTVAADYAAQLRARGLTVRVFTPDYHRKGGTDDVTRLRPLFAWGNAAIVPTLLWKLRAAHVIHLHYPFYGGDVFAVLASLLWRKPLVVTYHMKTAAKGWLGFVFRLHRACIEPFVLRAAKRVFFATAEYATTHGFAIGGKYAVLPFGVDTARFSVGRDDAFRAQYAIDVAATVLVFVGGLDAAHYFKGLGVLLQACGRLRSRDWVLMIVGSGNQRAAYEAQARELGIAEHVRFVGAVPFADLPRAYRAADIHVLPSLDRSEAFGLVTIEAAATGIPSIVSDLPGMRSLVLAGETGTHVVPGDVERLAHALEDLLQQDGRREVMGAAARARAERAYDRDRLLDRLIAAYNQV